MPGSFPVRPLMALALLAAGALLLNDRVIPGRGALPAALPAATVAPFSGNDPASPLLVDATWLTAHAANPHLRILDLSAIATYRRGHVPGAVHAWWQDTMDRYNTV